MIQPFARTFIITIARNAPKLCDTIAHLKSLEIDAEPFIGLDCEKTGLETKWTYEVDHPRSGYRIGPKPVSMNLSHYMLWKVCDYIDGDSFLLLEDDVRFIDDWKEHYDVAMTHLPDDWDLLYIGSCCCDGKDNKIVWGRLCKIRYALCTHAYAIRKKAIPTLLEHCEKIWTNIDISLLFNAIPRLNCYAMLPRLAYQHETIIPP